MLATNAFVVTLAVFALLGGVLYWFLGRPAMRRMNEVCEHIDEDLEARAARERLEREEEARARAQAEREISEPFSILHDEHPGEEPRIDETH